MPDALCKHRSSAEVLCAARPLRTSHPPGRSPHKHTGTNTQDRLTSTTARCLLQPTQAPAGPRRGGAHTLKQHRREGRRKYQVTKSKQASKQAGERTLHQTGILCSLGHQHFLILYDCYRIMRKGWLTDSQKLTFKIYGCQESLGSEIPCFSLQNVLIPRPSTQKQRKACSVSPGSTKHRESPRSKSSQFS